MEQHIKEVIKLAKEAWMSGNAYGFASLFLPSGEMIVPGKKWHGQQEIHDAFTEFIATNVSVKIHIRRILIAGNSAVVEWLWQEINNETGERSIAEDAIIVDFEDGLIRRWREYIDNNSHKVKSS